MSLTRTLTRDGRDTVLNIHGLDIKPGESINVRLPNGSEFAVEATEDYIQITHVNTETVVYAARQTTHANAAGEDVELGWRHLAPGQLVPDYEPEPLDIDE